MTDTHVAASKTQTAPYPLSKTQAWNLRRSAQISPEDLQQFRHQYQLLQQLTTQANSSAITAMPTAAQVSTNTITTAVSTSAARTLLSQPPISIPQQTRQLTVHASSSSATTIESEPAEHRRALATVNHLLRRLPSVSPEEQQPNGQQQLNGQQPVLQLTLAPPRQQQFSAALPSLNATAPVSLAPQSPAFHHTAPLLQQHSMYIQRLQQSFHALAMRMLQGSIQRRDTERSIVVRSTQVQLNPLNLLVCMLQLKFKRTVSIAVERQQQQLVRQEL